MAQTLDIPVDVPWSLVAASPDMMDTTFCDDAFPPPWRSSLAIYAYEPSADQLPPQLCNQKITYLKVTCSITGFQPTPAESLDLAIGNVTVALPGLPADAAEDLIDPYFGCYGALLNVAVFPSTTTLLQTTGTPQTYVVKAPGKGTAQPNPFAELGLQFSSPGLKQLTVRRTRPGGPWAILVTGQLQIDLPIAANVVLQMSVTSTARATVLAYQRGSLVFTAQISRTAGMQNVPISTSQPVTRIVLQVHGDGCLLAGLSYQSLERAVTLGDYPHIIDFEPKTRDLYQASTDQSEILTGSTSTVGTGKSLSNTASTQMGLNLQMGQSASANGAAAGLPVSGGSSYSAGLTGSWGETANDTSTTQIDQSRERRETQGTITNITQQYNIMTGYHAGTNRAVFLMLPRPHTLQATDYRTFVRGLRMIEGIQEFLLIVSRPAGVPGLCIEARLETGHFPENVAVNLSQNVTVTTPPPETKTYPFSQSAQAPGGTGAWQTPQTNTPFSFQLPDSSYTIDTTNPSSVPAGSGISYATAPVAGDNTSSPEYQQAASTLKVSATTSGNSVAGIITVTGAAPTPGELFGDLAHPTSPNAGTAARIQVNFTVYATQAPQTSATAGGWADSEPVVVSPFLITGRDLCACVNSCATDGCVTVGPTQQVPYSQSNGPIGGNAASGAGQPGSTATSSPAGAASQGSGSSAGAGAGGSGAGTPPPGGTASGSAAPSTAGPTANAAASPPAASGGSTPGAASMPSAAGASSTTASPAPAGGSQTAGAGGGAAAGGQRSSIVYEAKVKLPRGLLRHHHRGTSRTPAARELMYQVQYHMLASWRLPQRRGSGVVGFLESDYVCERLSRHFPQAYLTRPIAQVKGLSRDAVRNLGAKMTVGEALALELHKLRMRARVSVEEAVRIRRILLGADTGTAA